MKPENIDKLDSQSSDGEQFQQKTDKAHKHISQHSHLKSGMISLLKSSGSQYDYIDRDAIISVTVCERTAVSVCSFMAIAICDMNEFFSLKANHNTVISNHSSIVSFPFSGTQYRGNGPAHYCQYQTVGHRRLYRPQFPLTEGTIGLYMTINIRIGISMVLCTRFEHQWFGGGRSRWTNGEGRRQ